MRRSLASSSSSSRSNNVLSILLLRILFFLNFSFNHPIQVSALRYPTDSSGQPLPNSIQTFYISPRNLWENRDLDSTGLKELHPALNRILKLADVASADPTVYTVVVSQTSATTNAKNTTAGATDPLVPPKDPHDFYSLAPNWVRNPITATGLPYIPARTDGETNPEALVSSDAEYLRHMVDDTWYAALAYFWTGEDRYAEVAARRVRQWFVDDATKMNPNFEYANWVKGRSVAPEVPLAPVMAPAAPAALRRTVPSRVDDDVDVLLPLGAAVKENRKRLRRQAAAAAAAPTPASAMPTAPVAPAAPRVPTVPAVPSVPTAPAVPSVPAAPFSPAPPGWNTISPYYGSLANLWDIHRLLDGISLLHSSSHLTPTDRTAFNSWAASYLTWLQTSTHGQHETNLTDYRGVYHDLQQISLLLFLARPDEAAHVVAAHTVPRMTTQIGPDGKIIAELVKPNAWESAVTYIQGLFVIGHMTRNAPIYLDLFGVATTDGRSIRKAIEFLLPYALTSGSGWPLAPNKTFEVGNNFIELLKEAYVVYGDQRYLAAVAALQPEPEVWNPFKLWTPYAAFDVRVDNGARASLPPVWKVATLVALIVGSLWVSF
ncbi:mannuronate-specific alginate lyase [Powellomyces hirtus]|uniref:Mannuronate-specific alginate lyase n=1 Tax=Powellomyces hirtus TaxID=109895 RepID=A0A507E365_9FUNG|nr:mannuronate-specific alginate lyase [Powellomyces hirtus]